MIQKNIYNPKEGQTARKKGRKVRKVGKHYEETRVVYTNNNEKDSSDSSSSRIISCHCCHDTDDQSMRIHETSRERLIPHLHHLIHVHIPDSCLLIIIIFFFLLVGR